MKITCVGGGPAGLYFGLLMKQADPRHEVTVYERNRADDTFGFGVVFSDQTLENLEEADASSYRAITESFYHWDDIDIHYAGQVLRSTGHGFSGMSRQKLLTLLQGRCQELGVEIHFESQQGPSLNAFSDSDLIAVADGVQSVVRDHYQDRFRPDVDFRPNRFIWLGTSYPFEAFTFYFKENEHGLFRVHAYRYTQDSSTFIVECTAQTYENTGLGEDDEDAALAYFEKLFADELKGHRLKKNRSIWRQFPTVKNETWHFDNVVLLGDAVHTAHYSIGSGTKLAMEDAIFLERALRSQSSIEEALRQYETERRPAVESIQRAAQVSLEWFENTERYMGLEPVEFAVSLLTRSLRVTHENLRLRDPAFVEGIELHVAKKAATQSGIDVPCKPAPPPLFTPFKLRDLVLDNRVVVSPMCQYSAEDGTVNDWHLVHLGHLALGGAGLVITEMTDVEAQGRISKGCAGLYKPEHVSAWKRVVDFVHRHSNAKIGVQIAHAGRKASTKRPWEGYNEPLEEEGWPLIAPSALPFTEQHPTPKAMSQDDMDRVRRGFEQATRYAISAGFDLIELHCAHGYLLSSFISPLSNRRKDEYGGDIENRARFPLEVFDAVRKIWPTDRPISVRISATDWSPGGLQPEELVQFATMLKEHGCDIIDVSAGQTVSDQKPRYGRLFQTPFSELVRLEAKIPTITVGNISSYADVNSIIAAERADLCAIARGHLYDPYWTRHAAAALGHELPWPNQYRSLAGYNFRFE